MTSVRTLPIRLAPVAGEPVDSWLEALAARTHTAFGDLLSAVGLNPHHGMGTSAWIVQLTPDEAAAISASTGVTHATLAAMTLAHYAGRAVGIDHRNRTVNRTFPWGPTRGSRYCPACLKDTGGRWQLAWRLGWTFACTEHHCLLADVCPHCSAVQRQRTHVGDLVPKPGCCARPATSATGRSPARCDTDLTVAADTMFDVDHPVLHAQRFVNTIIDSATATSGVYRTMPQPRINVLADIRAVAGRALAYATPHDLTAVIPVDLFTAYHQVARDERVRSGAARPAVAKLGPAAPTRAACAAVGVIAAMHALDRPDVASAGEALRWLVATSRERGLAVTATNIGWGKNISPVLAGAQLAALGPMLKPSDHLRYRIGAAIPAQPALSPAHSTALARRLPSMLWPTVSLRLSIPNCHQRQLRPALSIAILLVNSRLDLDDAASLIGSHIEGHAVSRVLQLLEQHEQWPSIRAALIRVADHLAEHESPIDYQRRRRLDYTALLPDTIWAQICRDTATPGPSAIRARIARCFLFEKLSGLPAALPPFGVDTAAFRTKVADFPAHITPELAHALEEHAREFLADHGLDREPAVRHPPTDLFIGLDPPGPDPDAVDLAELHRLVAGEGIGLGAAATRLGTSLDTVRYLLEVHPAPRSVTSLATPAPVNRNRAYRTAKAALPRDRLAELYHHERRSLRDIAATVGVSRQIITQLAHDYDLDLREPGRHARTTVDRDWLYDQYVNKRRALPEIAKEAGMSTANMARWAKTHAIPMRERGGRSHSTTLAAERAYARQN